MTNIILMLIYSYIEIYMYKKIKINLESKCNIVDLLFWPIFYFDIVSGKSLT